MSTLANITSLNLSLQTGGAALAVNAVKSVAKPERVVYVFGTADDVAPNFTTVAGAITYANSLAPDPGNEPVVIRLFAKTDNTPYDLAGLSTWTTYANNGIYFVSDFVRLNETTTLPTTLPEGLTVWYRDSDDVEYLYVGNADGNAQLVASAPTAEEIRDELETLTGDDRLNGSAVVDLPLYEDLASTPTAPSVEHKRLKAFSVPTGNYLTIGNSQGVGRPSVGYRSIFFGVRQSSETSPPRVTVYHNTFSAIISATRTGTGSYTISFGQPQNDVAKIFFPSSPGVASLYPYYSEGDNSTVPACYFKISAESNVPTGTSFNISCLDGANDENTVDMFNVMGGTMMYFQACITEDIQLINP
jgi:hypothetical protein